MLESSACKKSTSALLSDRVWKSTSTSTSFKPTFLPIRIRISNIPPWSESKALLPIEPYSTEATRIELYTIYKGKSRSRSFQRVTFHKASAVILYQTGLSCCTWVSIWLRRTQKGSLCSRWEAIERAATPKINGAGCKDREDIMEEQRVRLGTRGTKEKIWCLLPGDCKLGREEVKEFKYSNAKSESTSCNG